MLCAPSNRRRPFSRHTKMASFVRFLLTKNWQTQKRVLNMARSDSQIDTQQRGRPKRAALPDVNINTGAQSINTESLLKARSNQRLDRRWPTEG